MLLPTLISPLMFVGIKATHELVDHSRDPQNHDDNMESSPGNCGQCINIRRVSIKFANMVSQKKLLKLELAL